jgi:hypothetical protein
MPARSSLPWRDRLEAAFFGRSWPPPEQMRRIGVLMPGDETEPVASGIVVRLLTARVFVTGYFKNPALDRGRYRSRTRARRPRVHLQRLSEMETARSSFILGANLAVDGGRTAV